MILFKGCLSRCEREIPLFSVLILLSLHLIPPSLPSFATSVTTVPFQSLRRKSEREMEMLVFKLLVFAAEVKGQLGLRGRLSHYRGREAVKLIIYFFLTKKCSLTRVSLCFCEYTRCMFAELHIIWVIVLIVCVACRE